MLGIFSLSAPPFVFCGGMGMRVKGGGDKPKKAKDRQAALHRPDSGQGLRCRSATARTVGTMALHCEWIGPESVVLSLSVPAYPPSPRLSLPCPPLLALPLTQTNERTNKRMNERANERANTRWDSDDDDGDGSDDDDSGDGDDEDINLRLACRADYFYLLIPPLIPVIPHLLSPSQIHVVRCNGNCNAQANAHAINALNKTDSGKLLTPISQCKGSVSIPRALACVEYTIHLLGL